MKLVTFFLLFFWFFPHAPASACLPIFGNDPASYPQKPQVTVSVYTLAWDLGFTLYEPRPDQSYDPGDCTTHIPVMINAQFSIAAFILTAGLALYVMGKRIYRFRRKAT